MLLVSVAALFIGACTTTVPNKNAAKAPATDNKGKYYLDDGPPEDVTIALADIPDAVPKLEKINPAQNRPYTALGKSFTPYRQLRPSF